MFKKIISESLVQSDDKNNIQKVVFKFTKIRLSGLKFIFSLSNIAEIIACFYFFLCLPSSYVSFFFIYFYFCPYVFI
jgi:ATP-dependent RNA circularization protein (DNA/RNA ligase family)